VKRILAATLIGAAALLGACGTHEPIAEGTVVSVQEIIQHDERDDSGRYYEPPMVPEVAWKVDVRLSDGSEVTIGHKGEKRYAPGERVRLLLDEEGALLL
jgi:hypothetical protein